MQHTLIAVFDNRNDAQAAKDELFAAGFAGAEIRQNEAAGTSTSISTSTSTSTTAAAGTATEPDDTGFGAGIRHFFADLLGADESQGSRYADAVARGQHVLTLVTISEQEVERAADIVERHGPVDIDEESGGHSLAGAQLAGGAAAATGANMGAGMSQQSAGGSVQGGASSVQGGPQTGMQASQLQGDVSGQQGSQQRAEGTVLPVVEEELRVGKRQIQRGGVRIFHRVVETPVNESVTLREEHISIERRPVDQPISAGDLANFEDKSIELRETAEEAVVEKSARVVEEVVVGKQVSEREQQIADTVRRTEVEVEQLGSGTAGTAGTGSGARGTSMLGADDNDYFRKHYDANYGSSGRSYQDYLPAYSYGSTMAANDQYRSKAWNDVEPSLRQDWESRNPGSVWEQFKAAIRHGWDKIRS